MTQSKQVYKCADCNTLLEVLVTNGKEINCCGQGMSLIKAKTQDEGQEKHVPVIKKTDNGIKVKIGEVAHPMEDEHYIQFIEIIADNKIYRQELKAGQEPEAEFPVQSDNVTAREYCNVHGLWQS
jgi:superoxide reductase